MSRPLIVDLRDETALDPSLTGGKAAYEKMRTQVTSAVMEFIGKGVKANMTMYHASPNKSYMVTEIQGIGKMEEGTDGSVVWERSAIKGPSSRPAGCWLRPRKA